MLNFNFNNAIDKNLKDYIKKSNEISLSKLKQKYMKNDDYKKSNNDYEIDFCDFSECSDKSDTKDCIICKNKRKNKKDDENYLCNCAHIKFISSIFLFFIGGTSIASLSLLYYKFYIKK
jgi:hypothetical protein